MAATQRTYPGGINPRSLGVEAAWIPVEYDQLDAFAEIAEKHFGFAQASGLANWLRKKAMGRPDPTTQPTRSRYRKLLQQLEELGETPPKPTGGQRIQQGVESLMATGVEGIGSKAEELARAKALSREGGFITVTLPLVAVALGAAAAAAARTGSVGAGVLTLLPDITSDPGDVDFDAVGEGEGAGQGLAPVIAMRTGARTAGAWCAHRDAHDSDVSAAA
jgi:hypothetical protein